MRKRYTMLTLVFLAAPLVTFAAVMPGSDPSIGTNAQGIYYRDDPYGITIDGRKLYGNITVSTADGVLDAADATSSNPNLTSLTMTRAYSDNNLSWYHWLEAQKNGNKVRKSITIVIHDTFGGPDTPVFLYGCYAANWGVIDMSEPDAREMFTVHCDSAYVPS